MTFQLIDFSEEYLKFIRMWEESGEIYNYLSHSRPKCLSDGAAELWQTTRLYMIRLDTQIVGCVWLEDLDFINKVGKLGIYLGEIPFRGMGVGRAVIKKILDLAFGQLGLNKIILHVRENNARAIYCYKSCGFVFTREFPKRLFSDGSFQGVFEMAVTGDL